MIHARPEMFYRQEWYWGEAFMDKEPSVRPMPKTFVPLPNPQRVRLYSCATWVALYLAHPTDPLWMRYVWTSDMDLLGQRVYVGSNGKGLEIHRHLHLTDRWVVPLWT